MALSPRDRTYTLIGILLALFLGALDQTIVSTALPRIVADLNGLRRYDWVATAYLLASTALVPIYGRLADITSRRQIELVAIGIFLAGSFLCGLAGEFGTLPLLGDGMNQLILFRAVQGIGGVVEEVRPELVELAAVAENWRYVVWDFAVNTDVPELTAEQDERVLQTFADVDILNGCLVHVRIRFERPDDLRQSFRSLADFRQ